MSAQSGSSSPRKRGRPKIYATPADRPSFKAPTGNPRGRPRKYVGAVNAPAFAPAAGSTSNAASASRIPGRPRKNVPDSSSADSAASSEKEDDEEEEEELDDFKPDLTGTYLQKKMHCCDEDVPGRVLVCGKRAVVHGPARQYHLSCSDAPASFRGEWRCDECDAAADDHASNPGSSEDESLDDGGITPDQKREDIFGSSSAWGGPFIFEERWRATGDAMEYRVGQNDDASASWMHEDKVPPRVRHEFHVINGEAQKLISSLPNAPVPAALVLSGSLREADEEWNQMLKHLRRGYWSLARAIYPQVKAGRRLRDFPRVDLFQSLMDKILCQMPPLALEGICGEGLRRLRVLDGHLAAGLDRMMLLSVNHPCHYCLELCDISGRALLCGDMRKIIASVRKYCALDKAHILLVDSVFHDLKAEQVGDINNDVSCKYLAGLNRSNQTSYDVLELCDELGNLITHLADGERCPFLLRDIGYTDNGKIRVNKQQRRHRAVNKIMGLFEACSVVEFGNKYRIFGDVVLLCAEPIQAEAGEVTLSLIAQSYSQGGRGFNAVEGGTQQSSMAKYPRGDVRWDEWQSQAIKQLDFERNIADERSRRLAYNAQVNQLRSKMRRLQFEDARENVAFAMEVSDRIDGLLELDSELAIHVK